LDCFGSSYAIIKNQAFFLTLFSVLCSTTPAVAVARHMNSVKKTFEMLLTGEAMPGTILLWFPMLWNMSMRAAFATFCVQCLLIVVHPLVAREALQYGLVNKVVEGGEEELTQATVELAEKIAQYPPRYDIKMITSSA
jgi:hypothetical protein